MKTIILKRKGLGITSCKSLKRYMRNNVDIVKCWKQSVPNIDILFRWGCTASASAVFTYNTAQAISFCSDKINSRNILQKASPNGVPLVPPTYFMVNEDLLFLQKHPEAYPLVFRPGTHHSGNNFFIVNTYDEIMNLSQRFDNWYLTKYIDKIKEYRFYLINNRLVWIAEKIPQNSEQKAWNLQQGAVFVNKWDMQTFRDNIVGVQKAIFASYIAEIDFCGVDVIIDKDGTPYILELNSAPSLTEINRQKRFAETFDWIVFKTTEIEEKIKLEKPVYTFSGNLYELVVDDFLHPSRHF